MSIPNNICVDEKATFLNVKNRYKIYDETSGEVILQCVEQGNFGLKLLKLIGLRNFVPLHISVYLNDKTLFEIKRSFWASFRIWYQLKVYNEDGTLLGLIDEHSKTNPEIRIYNNESKLILKATSNNLLWSHYNYVFKRKGYIIAKMNKEWKDRILKEMFTSADKYRIEFNPKYSEDQKLKKLTLASCLSIDLLLKEKNGGKSFLNWF